MGPQLEALAKDDPGLRLLHIDVDSWNSPVAQQYSIKSLPTVHLYDGTRLVTNNTNQALNELLR